MQDVFSNLVEIPAHIRQPYITHIRFPYYKKLKYNLSIKFKYPITVIIGSNGSSKSSILRAIYGAPDGKSLGAYWFDSEIDSDSRKNSSFIYGYYNVAAKRDVEVRKMRVYAKAKHQGYWETARPSLEDGMEPMPDVSESPTRWPPIQKNVVYMDFRHATMSAFDRYFYSEKLDEASILQIKKDFICFRSKYLNDIIKNSKKTYLYYNKERVRTNIILPKEQIKEISNILDKQYSKIIVVDHAFYTNTFETTIYLSTNGLYYSEAFAGSGEFAVISLVKQIMESPAKSLIILDEPEVSLHPNAQKKLMLFLANEVLKKQHQIIFATHSPFLIEDLPKEAINVLYENPNNEIDVISDILPELAFSHIGASFEKKTIIVEDEIAKKIIEHILAANGMEKHIDVLSSPNGESTIKTISIVNSALFSNSQNILYMLDGDQKILEHIDPHNIPESENAKLDDIIKSQTGCSINIPHPNERDDVKIQNQRKYLLFYKKYVHYFPTQDPENIIWDSMSNDDKKSITNADIKMCFYELTKQTFGENKDTAEYILKTQEIFLNKIDAKNNEYCKEIFKIIEKFYNNTI